MDGKFYLAIFRVIFKFFPIAISKTNDVRHFLS